jgi:3-oxoadipate enol-lactonase
MFINALGTDLRIWDGVVAHLDGRFPTLCYDKRGHGLSGAPPLEYTIEDHRRDVVSVLDGVGIEAIVLVGISVGGLIALDMAATHPERVTALVLCDTGARIGSPEVWEARIGAIRSSGLSAVSGDILSRWFAPDFADRSPVVFQRCAEMLESTPEVGYTGTCATLRDTDLREVVDEITHPTLVLCGAEDRPTPPDMGRELAAGMPRARFELIEGAGHLPPVEQPGAVTDRITDFLAELPND